MHEKQIRVHEVGGGRPEQLQGGGCSRLQTAPRCWYLYGQVFWQTLNDRPRIVLLVQIWDHSLCRHLLSTAASYRNGAGGVLSRRHACSCGGSSPSRGAGLAWPRLTSTSSSACSRWLLLRRQSVLAVMPMSTSRARSSWDTSVAQSIGLPLPFLSCTAQQLSLVHRTTEETQPGTRSLSMSLATSDLFLARWLAYSSTRLET
ncbi:MAG: hypothetical protein FRX49_07408 [Trebouxia sp. A1-2]|nr:MAG: hypothetical protein FRX49_07408 [Trebouxia sp. A1-2]